MSEDFLTPEEIAARHREQAILRALARMLKASGDRAEPMLLLARAQDAWDRIPTDALMLTVEKAIYRFGAPYVNVDRVAETWRDRRKRIKPSAEELDRRRRMYEARVEREAAPPEVRDAFFARLIELTNPSTFRNDTHTRAHARTDFP